MRSRFQTGITYNAVGAVFNQGSTFAVNAIVANLLGRHTFGEYAMVQSTLLALALIAQMGTGYTATKYVAEFRSTDRDRAGRVLGMLSIFAVISAGIAALVLLFLAPWIAGSVLKAAKLGPALGIGSGVLLFAALNGFLIGALAGLESYRTLARALMWSGIAYLVVCTGSAWWAGLNGAVEGLAFSGLIQFVLLAFSLRRECSLQGIRIHYVGIAQERPIIVKFALPGALSGMTSMPALWLASAFLVRQPNGYSQMAIYSASFGLMAAVLFLPNITNSVGMSLINYHKGTGNEREYRRTFWINVVVTATIVIPGAGIFALLGPDLLHLFGKDFKDGYPVLLILLLATIPEGFTIAINQIVQSSERMWLAVSAVNLPRDSSIAILAFLLAPSLGARGVASAYFIGRLLAFLTISVIVWRTGLLVLAEKDRNSAAEPQIVNYLKASLLQASASCPLCGRDACQTSKTLSEILDLPGNTAARVTICRTCGCKFLYPCVPKNLLDDMYSKAYFTGADQDAERPLAPASGESYDGFAEARMPKFASSLDLIFEYVANPRNILDIGAATGTFLSFARARGLSVAGVELSKYAAQIAEQRYGIKLAVCELDEFVSDQNYDIIHVNHALEHFIEPRRAVSSIERLLSKKGVVYVEVPFQFNVVERMNYILFRKKFSFNIHSIHHPTFFDPNSLVMLFRDYGMVPVYLRVFDPSRYSASGLNQSTKRFAWTILSVVKQGIFIEAIFSRN
jgi:O-antigen/teichoic acid export membrane protein/SAM-dependent methyltransferase